MKLKETIKKVDENEDIVIKAGSLERLIDGVIVADDNPIENPPLTVVQQNAFTAVLYLTDKLGQSPSLRDIAAHMGYKSHNSASSPINALIKKGYLSRSPVDGLIQVVKPFKD